jgi:hypothetical protein
VNGPRGKSIKPRRSAFLIQTRPTCASARPAHPRVPPRDPEASTKSGAPRGWSDPFRAVDTVSRTAPARHCSSWHCSSWPVLWRNFPRDPFGRCVLAGSGPLNDTQPSSLVSAVEPRQKIPSDAVWTVRATAYGRKFVRGAAPARNFPQTPFRRCVLAGSGPPMTRNPPP